jgi:hypothetical protein
MPDPRIAAGDPCTQRIDRLIDLLEQIRKGGRQGTGAPE